MHDVERTDPSLRIAEITSELTGKRARVEEIKKSAPQPDYMTNEDYNEMTELSLDIGQLERELLSLQSNRG